MAKLPTSYGLRGKVGDETKLGHLALGAEVVLAVRCTVSSIAHRLDDGIEVAAVTLRPVTVSAPLRLDVHGMAEVRKALDAAAAADGQLPL